VMPWPAMASINSGRSGHWEKSDIGVPDNSAVSARWLV
jgi:hypothetical protein